MDAEIIEAIDSAQAAINAACLRCNKLSVGQRAEIDVKDYQTLEDIATMLYGDDGWKAIGIEPFGDWKFYEIESPEGVTYRYSDSSHDCAMAALNGLAVS